VGLLVSLVWTDNGKCCCSSAKWEQFYEKSGGFDLDPVFTYDNGKCTTQLLDIPGGPPKSWYPGKVWLGLKKRKSFGDRFSTILYTTDKSGVTTKQAILIWEYKASRKSTSWKGPWNVKYDLDFYIF
jgi:hypothetical protein